MITKTRLMEIIRNGENSGVEFKRDDINPQGLAKELVALSNFEGGMVLLGVEDDGTVSGIMRDNLEEWVMGVCRDKIAPGLIPFYETFTDVAPGKTVAVVRVPRGGAVYSQRHNNRNTYYIRVGTQSREADTYELQRLFQQRRGLRADLSPVPGVQPSDLDRRRLRDYFGRLRQQQDVPEDDDDAGWEQLLFNTEIMVDEGVTLSGLLLFGKNPNKFLPQAGISAMAFSGEEKDYSFKENKKLQGPMTPLQSPDGEIVETGLVEQALEFIRRNTRTDARLGGGTRRVERPTYPPEVIREAVVNALVHRDYLFGSTDVELAIYENRLEIISPGRLPNGLTPERMRAGTRSPRNLMLVHVMGDYGYVERMGMGVPRKIIKGMRDHNGTEVELVDEHERFTVRIFQ